MKRFYRIMVVILCLCMFLNINVIANNKRIIRNVYSYSWSPNGKYIVFDNWSVKYGDRIYLYSVETERIVHLGNGLFSAWVNNNEILKTDLVKINIDTLKQQHFIIEEGLQVTEGTISPNGDKIVYVCLKGDLDRNVYTAILMIEKISHNSYKEYLLNAGHEDIRIVGWMNNNQIVISDGGDYLKLIDLNQIDKVDITSKTVNEYYEDLVQMDKKRVTLKEISYKECAGLVKGDVLSYDGKYLAKERNKNIDVIEVETGKVKKIIEVNDLVFNIKWSPTEYILGYITGEKVKIRDKVYERVLLLNLWILNNLNRLP